jgi:Flp pilus assembly pilin Flp
MPTMPRVLRPRPRALLRRLRRDECGASVVEFALVVPILFLIVFGIVDFSRAFYTMSSLAAAVREGGRLAATARDPCRADLDGVKDVVVGRFTPFGSEALARDRVHVYSPDAALQCVLPPCVDASGLDEEDVAVCVDDYPFNPVTPVLRDAIPMTPRAVFRREGL